METQTEAQYLGHMVQNIRNRCEQIEIEHAKLDAEKKLIQGYQQAFQNRLHAINKG